jgi:hypothetical protein
MLIVCTRDRVIVQTAQDPGSGSGMWGTLVILDPRYNQAQATVQMTNALRAVRVDEPLCFSAHGNDTEIGDELPTGWGWSCEDLALILQDAMPRNYAGPILIHACAQSVSNFSAGLVLALERIRALAGVWIYGYQRAVPANAGFPDPNRLAQNRELYGTRVSYRPARSEKTEPHAGPSIEGCYRVSFPNGPTVTVPQGFSPEELRQLLELVAESPLR